MSALVGAKREMFLEELEVVDARDLMTTDTNKWLCISQQVMKARFYPCMLDGPTYKTKWNQIMPDYKRIVDFHARTGRNDFEYWKYSSSEHAAEGLPKTFSQDLYMQINEWFGQRPQIQPPQVRDLLSPNDNNFKEDPRQKSGSMHESNDNSESKTHDRIEISDSYTSTSAANALNSQRSPSAINRQCDQVANKSLPIKLGAGIEVQSPSSCIPGKANMPFYISSMDEGDSNCKRKVGTTVVKRKSLSGHTVIAEATRASGEVVASQMKEMADASCQIEKNKIEVQLKLFSEQMAYQREKDRRLHEAAVSTNETARLSILKQGEVANCLSQLSHVLLRGLKVSPDPTTSGTIKPANEEGLGHKPTIDSPMDNLA